MRIVRARAGGEAFYAVYELDKLKRISGLPYGGITLDGREYPAAGARLLAPVEPSKIVCVGRNYYEHIMELGNAVPKEPLIFYKPTTSLCGPGDAVPYPSFTNRLEHEAELAVVIGKAAKAVRPGESKAYIFGYACLNDVTARDVQAREASMSRSKGCDGCCPIGPWVETELDAANARIRCRVNGELRQDESTALMMHSIDSLICFISECMTLLPGDVIATGTPKGVSQMRRGDTVEVEIDGIGILRNEIS